MRSIFCISFGILLIVLTYYLNYIAIELYQHTKGNNHYPNEFFVIFLYVISVAYIIYGIYLERQGK